MLIRRSLFIVGSLFSLGLNAQEIAIMDQGKNTRFTNKGVFYNPACYSDDLYESGSFTAWDDISYARGMFPVGGTSLPANRADHASIKYVSLCHTSFSSTSLSSSADVPKRKSLPPVNDFGQSYKKAVLFARTGEQGEALKPPFQNIEFGRHLSHGTHVANAAYDFDPNVSRKMIQIFHLSDKKKNFTDCSANAERTLTRNSGAIGGTDKILRVWRDIANNPDGIDAINMSVVFRTGYCNRQANMLDLEICRSEEGIDEITALRKLGIPVVVGLKNIKIGASELTWPACLDGVIKVGSENFNRNTGSTDRGIGVGGMDIDFYAKNTVSTNNPTPGNSLASPKIATAYAVLKEAVPKSSLNQRTQALGEATKLRREYNINGKRYNRPYVRKSDITKAIEILDAKVAGNTTEVFFEDTNEYGPLSDNSAFEYSFGIDFDDLIGVSNNVKQAPLNGDFLQKSVTVPSQRDIMLSFDGRTASTSQVNSFRVLVNNLVVKDTYSFSGPKSFTFVINRKRFTNGVNTIRIVPVSNRPWALKNIKADFLPVVSLTVGTTDVNEYGYLGTPTRFTGLRASFNLPLVDENYVLSMTGWDIDRSDENEVFINGVSLGYLTKGAGSSQYSRRNRFFLNSNDLVVGQNIIELVQRRPDSVWNGVQFEKWAVKDILISEGNPITIAPVIMLLLDDD